MIFIDHCRVSGYRDGWILAHDTAEAAERADEGGQGALAIQLRNIGKPKRGMTSLGAGWTMIAGEAGR